MRHWHDIGLIIDQAANFKRYVVALTTLAYVFGYIAQVLKEKT